MDTVSTGAPSTTDAVRRELDGLRGFAYLESFDQLYLWTDHDVDALQRSNIPLLQRAQHASDANGAKVMLIHDYAGGYNDYERCQGASVPKEQYSCDYLQYVETFVYFSHRLVTIPPPTWTNSCHRSGVKVLGTFIVEPGAVGVESILQQDEQGRYWVAHKLALMAKCYGFDGWLVNIETTFPLLSWSADRMCGFLRQLGAELGENCQVVWYDALTALNFVWYQNTLNSLNLQFAQAAGSTLTNYAWNPELAQTGRSHAIESGLGLENLYFGIDVWAQNTQVGSKHPRITWPRTLGGGTGTGLGVKALQELGLNSGIFAPGWSYEHFNSYSAQVEKAIWQGRPLPKDLSCECNPAKPHDAAPYEQHGVSHFAKKYSAGSATFFHTNFARAFTNTEHGDIYADLGSQSIPPFETEATSRSTRLLAEARNSPRRCVISVQPKTMAASIPTPIQIAKVAMDATQPLKLTVRYRLLTDHAGDLSLQANGKTGDIPWRLPLHPLPSSGGQLSSLECTINPHRRQRPSSAWLTGISICYDPTRSTLPLAAQYEVLEIHSLTILLLHSSSRSSCKISNLRIEQRGAGPTRHSRLSWIIDKELQLARESVLPYSDITGPCAYFIVRLDGKHVGRAYALEFVLPDCFRQDGDIHEVTVHGYGFDDEVLCEARFIPPAYENDEEVEDWVMIDC